MVCSATKPILKGDETREAIDALGGYVYQIYQSALAWIELEPDEFLFLEVAEDYAIVAADDTLKAVQVKETGQNVTINSEDIVASIDSFVHLLEENPQLKVTLHHLTTSKIGKEQSAKHRIDDTPTLVAWRQLAKAGDLKPLREILNSSKLSTKTKKYILKLSDREFREDFLKRIHFDCGELDSKFIEPQLRSKLLTLVIDRGGVNSQVDGCLSSILLTLLRKAKQKEDRYVDRNLLEELIEKATQIPVNLAQYDAQQKLISKVLATFVPQSTNLVATRLTEPRPIDEVPFPPAIASREIQIKNIVSSLTQYGVSWIFGAAGVGKTIGAKIAARSLGGKWAVINLRSLNAEQVDVVLSGALDKLTEQKNDGFLIDDLECQFEPYIIDKLLNLQSICNRKDLLLLFTSPRPSSPDFLFKANLSASIEQKFEEFTEHDIQEILSGLGVVHNVNWAKYIHVVSGGGHPQLAIAAIQSMQTNHWDLNELRTLNSLLSENQMIEQVRALTRERLLNELPEGGRRLIERLSLKAGSFRRNFVLDMAQLVPPVPDGGIVFDRLIGSWVDQQERDRFALSPLLSNFAIKTLTDEKKREINFEIANSLVKGRSIDPIDANSALIAAWHGKNTRIIVQLCIAILGLDQNDLKMIAPYLMMFTCMRTDTFAYEENPAASQMFRGAQLLLLCQEERRREKVREVLDRFDAESDRVDDKTMRFTMAILVYAKLLLSIPKFGALPNFGDLIRKLDVLLDDREKHLPPEFLGKEAVWEMEGISVVGFMFLNQARQIKLINELLLTFEFLDSCGHILRQKLLKPYRNPDVGVDMLVSGAWLSEHDAKTIDSIGHSEIFYRLEKFAKSWDYKDLTVCCRKFRAIIIDESGGDKDHALAVLDEGLKLYGETNSELVREKAKVLYRAEDHQRSLELSKALIEGNASLSETEKAFLGRDAAISAEKQGDYETARHYYLYGSKAAGNCSNSDMKPMRVGLMADAALASWHADDRQTCLRDLVVVLQELKDIDPKNSLRAAHCHAVCRHILLWLDQDATGEKRLLADGEETKVYPGVVSNPEPHSEIGEQYIAPIEIAWYMLATIENHSCIDVGINLNLATLLPSGPVFEGQWLLTFSKMRKAFMLFDPVLFIAALKESVAQWAFGKVMGGYKNSFDIKNVTYGTIPIPTLEQQAGVSDLTEQFILCFLSYCIFEERVDTFDKLIEVLVDVQGFKVRKEILTSLQGHGSTTDYNTYMARLIGIHRCVIETKGTVLPAQIFDFVFNALQIASITTNIHIISKPAFGWLSAKWHIILDQQRFLLTNPSFYEISISQVLAKECDSWIEALIDLLQSILPTMGFNNESQYEGILNDIRMARC